MKEDTLENCVRRSLRSYFKDLDGESASGVYDMVLTAMEKPLFEVVLEMAQGNQSHAADILGINRNTLRKKLDQYGLR